MANSSFTGSVSGYASGTQPGIVSTVAQTFAGDKTLSGLITANSGIINTGLTGANATAANTSGSLKVGEVRTYSFPGTAALSIASPVTGTWYQTTDLIPTVLSGIYLICCDSIPIEAQGVCQVKTQVGFCDSSGNLLGGTTGMILGNTISGIMPVSTFCTVNVTSTINLRMKIRISTLVSGTCTQLSIRDDYTNGGQRIYLTRIA